MFTSRFTSRFYNSVGFTIQNTLIDWVYFTVGCTVDWLFLYTRIWRVFNTINQYYIFSKENLSGCGGYRWASRYN